MESDDAMGENKRKVKEEGKGNTERKKNEW